MAVVEIPDFSIDKEKQSTHLGIVIRGQTFRCDVEKQLECIRSIFHCFIAPVQQENIEVSVVFCVYEHEKNNLLYAELRQLSDKITIINKECSPSQIRSQPENFIYCIRIAEKMGLSTLVTRADLIFNKDIPAHRLQSDMMLFQWNTFHNYDITEVPDQVHYIGSALLERICPIVTFAPLRLGVLPDKTGAGSLHNFYNVLIHEGIQKSHISYLYHFDLDESAYEGSMCLLRGNSNRCKIPGFYDYSTTPPTKEKIKSVYLSIKKKMRSFFFFRK